MDMVVTRGEKRTGSVIAGLCLLVLSSLLAISLLLGYFSLTGSTGLFSRPGEILFSVYGFSSVLVPVFLLCASILLLVPGWSVHVVVALAGSIVPFFTAVLGEKLIRNFGLTLANESFARFVTVGLVVSTGLAILVEYILLVRLGDIVAAKESSRSVDHDEPSGDIPAVGFAFAMDDRTAAPAVLTGDVPEEMDDATSASAMVDVRSEVDPAQHVAAEASLSADLREIDDGEDRGTDNDVDEESVSLSVDTDRIAGATVTKAVASVAAVETARSTAAPSIVQPPTYVDFEKMKAPFDLPVIDDWVEGEANPAMVEHPADDVSVAVDGNPSTEYDADRDAVSTDSVGDDINAIEDGMLDQIDVVPAVGETGFVDASDSTFDIDVPADDFPDDAEFDDAIKPADIDIDAMDDDPSLDADLEAEADTDEALVVDSDDACMADSALPPVVSVPPAPHESDAANPEPAGGLLAIAAAAGRAVLKKKRVAYSVPFDILTSYPDGEYWIVDDTTRKSAVALKETLNEFHIEADVTGIRKGPVITMFEILPAPGVKLSKIVGLQDNIALRLAASSVRIVAPIPGKHAVGIEVPNQKRSIVSFRELIETDTPQAKKMEIPVVLGKDITGEAQLLDLSSTPHLLIAGSTGSGKSVCVNSIILSILYKRSPEDVKLILIDPKIVELKLYNDIAHLLSPVITEPKKAFQALQYCLCEMERRYALLDGMGVRDIKSYNRRIKERDIATEKIPYIVIIIDEFADLMATTGKELESTVARLCAMSRAVGIHLVLATQRPSIDVITGLIKANIPTRIAFMVASKMDSRIIIDQVGAEKLLGRGDMLYAGAVDPFPVRIQGAFVSEEEVERVVDYVKTLGEPEYIDEEMFVEDDEDGAVDPGLFSDGEDPLYEKALEIVLLAGKASASYIQRKLKIGYNRAARLVEDMEARGIVGPANGSKPREVIHHV
jgi:S-DNA-T family DNA segregation ATPase FtsK/SpoIIIE